MKPENHFVQSLGLLDATMIVAGSMIGSGIFIVSADILRNVGSPGWLLVVWVITGAMTLMAAVSYGELSSMYPQAGGQYLYLREAYNSLIGFLYGWSFFTVIQTGAIAAVGVAFSKFTGYFFPVLEINDQNLLFRQGWVKIYPAQLLSIGLILFLTWINTRGIKEGKVLQTFITVVKIAALFGLIIFGILKGTQLNTWKQNWANGWVLGNISPEGIFVELNGLAALGAIAAAMVGSVFSSDAWNSVTFIAGEIRNPKRNIGLSLFLGTLSVTLLYLIGNVMYLSVLSVDEIIHAPSDRVGTAASLKIFGSSGGYIMAALIMISTFGCNNGLILSGARVYYSMAKDGLFFKKAAILNNNGVPEWALWAQCFIASLLCMSGRYGDLLDMVSFVVVLFYVLTIVGIFVLRKKKPAIDRPYKAWGYPVVPLIYICSGILFCGLLILYKPAFTWPGLIIVLTGIPVYYITRIKKEAKPKI